MAIWVLSSSLNYVVKLKSASNYQIYQIIIFPPQSLNLLSFSFCTSERACERNVQLATVTRSRDENHNSGSGVDFIKLGAERKA